MSTLLTPDPVYTVSEAITREALLTLCHDLEAAGIWLYLQDDTTLIAGPPELCNGPRHCSQVCGPTKRPSCACLRTVWPSTSLGPRLMIPGLSGKSVPSASAPV